MNIRNSACGEDTVKQLFKQCVSQPRVQDVFCIPNFPKTHPILTNSNMDNIGEPGIASAHPEVSFLANSMPWSLVDE
jgi:hypothetical protein